MALSVEAKARIAELWAAGAPAWQIREEAGVSRHAVLRQVRRLRRRVEPERERSPLRLSLVEREEISRGLAAGESLRGIGRGQSARVSAWSTRRTARLSRVLAVFGLVAVLLACSNAAESSKSTSADGLYTLEPAECGGGDCVAAFTIGDAFLEPSCDTVRAELVTSTLLAADSPEFAVYGVSKVSAIEGVNPMAGAAVVNTSCGPGWSWASVLDERLSAGDRARVIGSARCEVLTTPQPTDRCEEGGAVAWEEFGDPRGDVQLRFVPFADYVARVNDAVVADPTGSFGWRSTPLDVATRSVVSEPRVGALCGILEASCRVLFHPVAETFGADKVSYRGLVQHEYAVNDPKEWAVTTMPFTAYLERVGQTWWLTGIDVELSIEHGVGAAGRAAADVAAVEYTVIAVDDPSWPFPSPN